MTIEARPERPLKARSFVCSPEQVQVAQNILEEAKQFGGNVDHFKIDVNQRISTRLSLLEPYTEGLIDLRRAAREQVLLANGANPEDVFIESSIRKAKEEAFNRDDSFFFVVWKDVKGNIVASGDMEYMFDTPLVKKLLSLGPTSRGWQEVVCWNLGLPEITVDDTHEQCRRIQPETATFLFSDEIKELKSNRQLLAYVGSSLYEEQFEGYLIDKEPIHGWQTLFKIRGRLFD